MSVLWCRFERIAQVVPQLDVAGKYKRILAKYHEEIDKVGGRLRLGGY